MSNFSDKYIACPFFFKQEARKIYCEGFSRGNRIHLSFETHDLMRVHQIRYCESIKGCKDCPIYPLISKKYEEDG